VTWAWRGELWKIGTVRGQWVSAFLVTMAIPVTSFLVVTTGGLAAGEATTSAAATGSLVGLLAFGAWSAMITAGEYAHGTMVASLTTVPRRTVFYAAKLSAIATAAGAAALLSATVSLLVVIGIRAPGAYPLGNPASLFGVVLVVVVVAVTGVSVAVITRSPSASAAIVVAALLLPKAASGLLGGLQPWVVGASPGTVITEMVGGASVPTNQAFPAGTWAAALTMVGVAAVVVGLGALALFRRDG
jgi:ABC-type transport system involved in multi-copper enzyme maturation permease subunit